METTMKLGIITAIGVMLIFGCVQKISAHIYEFSNHTEEPIMIRVKLDIDPKWYEVIIEPHKGYEFLWVAAGHPREKEGRDIWEAGLCLQEINIAVPLKNKVRMLSPEGEYIGTTEEIKREHGKVVFGAWKNVSVEWIEDEGVNAMLSAAESFASNLQRAATSVLEAVTGD